MKKTAAVTVCLLWLLLLLAVSTPASSPPSFLVSPAEAVENSWASKAPMHVARGGLGVAVVNGKIYAIGGSTEKGEWSISGGFVGTGGVVGTNEEYDPALDTWTFKASMPTPRYHFAIAIYQNKIYCIGGATKTSDHTEVIEAYDPATNIWETKTPMPTAKVAGANIVNGKIYFIGGNPNNTLNQVYDPATDSWAIKTPIPTEAYGASAVINNKIYFISYSYSGGQYNVLNQIYDPETDKWSQGAPPPSGGVGQGSVVVTTGKMAPKRIYVLDEVLRVYNPETDGWTFGANISTYRENLGIALVNDMLYAIGGNTYTFEYLYTQIRGGSVTPYATNEQYTPFGYGIVPPPDTTPHTSEPFPITWIVAAIAIIAIVGAALLIYFAKVKKTTRKVE